MNTTAVMRSWRVCLATGCCLFLLSACGGSNGDGTGTAGTPDTGDENPETTLGQDMTPDSAELGVVGPLATPSEPAPDELASLDRVSLVVSAESRCAVVGEAINVSVTRSLTEAELAAGDPATPPDVAAYVTYSQGLGDSLSLLSVTNSQASFSLQRQDVLSLTAELDNGSVTAYLAGFADDTPTSAVLRKPVPGGCLYAFRIPGYCATGLAKGGTLSFNRDGQGISAMGCELTNPGNLPVIDLPPPEPVPTTSG